MFGAEIQLGEQRAVFTMPASGLSKHGKDVPLENQKIESANPAIVVVAPHENGNPLMFVARAADGYAFPVTDPPTTSVNVTLIASADGRPGEGEVVLQDPNGALVLRSPDAATLGAIAGAVEEIT